MENLLHTVVEAILGAVLFVEPEVPEVSVEPEVAVEPEVSEVSVEPEVAVEPENISNMTRRFLPPRA